MPKPRPAYPPEFRHQLIELVRAGRSPEQLAQEFEPLGPDDPHLGPARRARCGPAHRRLDDPGAGGAHPPAAGAAPGQTRARDPRKRSRPGAQGEACGLPCAGSSDSIGPMGQGSASG